MQSWGVIPNRYSVAEQPTNGFVPKQSLTIVNTTNSAAAASSAPSFAALSFGDATVDRVIIAAIGSRRGSAGGALATVIIGGVSATVRVSTGSGSAGTQVNTEIWSAAVPSSIGTSGTVALTYSVGAFTTGISLYALYNSSNAGAPTGTATAISTTTVSSLAGSVSYTAPAAVVGVTATERTAGAVTNSWSGLTEDSSAVIDVGNGASYGAASGLFTSDVSVGVGVTYSNSVNAASLAAASFA